MISKEIVIESINIAKQIVKENLDDTRLSDSKEKSQLYNNKIKPLIEDFKIKNAKTPNILLQNYLQNFIEQNELEQKYEPKGFHYYGQKLNPYCWACITKKDPCRSV